MTSFNKVIVAGRLTRDPELRYTPSGSAVGGFGLAVNRKYKHGDDVKEETHFFDIITFGKLAESCGQHLSKGTSVIVEGRLQQRRWDDKATGQKRSKVDIAAQTVTTIGAQGTRVSAEDQQDHV